MMATILPQPADIPDTWRDRGRKIHFVMLFTDDQGERVVSRYWSNRRGWQYECESLEMLRYSLQLQAENKRCTAESLTT